jgi:hypothetical protein
MPKIMSIRSPFNGEVIPADPFPMDMLEHMLKVGFSPVEYEAEDKEESERQEKRDTTRKGKA